MRAASTLLGLLLLLTSCGVNLSIVQQKLHVKLPDGARHSVRVVQRPESGLLQPNFDESVACWLPQTVFAVLLEPVDLIASTVAAVDAMFDPNHDIAGGPVGWLAAMTPVATLVPQIHISYIFGRRIDAKQWQQLSSEDEADRRAAARRIWPNRNITYVHPFVAAPAEDVPTTSGSTRAASSSTNSASGSTNETSGNN
tara:strand:+ start:12596 stop:13189 length:594 start_codon:yes stop_codon:yes gene_type:complete